MANEQLNTSVVADESLTTTVESVVVYGMPGPSVDSVRRFEFPPSLVWLVVHNMGTRSFIERLSSSDGERFSARVKTVDENSFSVHLTAAVGGFVDVVFDTSQRASNYE
jgi:hypothetical protein